MSKSNLPFWSVDAFLFMAMNKSHDNFWSSELVSRVASFVDAYVLFDKVVLLERYREEAVIKQLDANGTIFEFIESSKLHHSDELAKGITLDLLAFESIPSLEADNYKWFSQHQGYASNDEYDDLKSISKINMAELRLWQHCLVKEVADLTGSVSLLPLSLQEIEEKRRAIEEKPIAPFQYNKYREFDKIHQGKLKFINEAIEAQASGYLTGIPPLLTLLIDQALGPSHLIETLILLRKDYSSFRTIGSTFQAALRDAKTIEERVECINQWNESWNKLVKGEFKRPTLLSKKVSSADISKTIWTPSNLASVVTQGIIDYSEERKTYKRLSIFSYLHSELNEIENIKGSLKNKFLINFTNKL